MKNLNHPSTVCTLGNNILFPGILGTLGRIFLSFSLIDTLFSRCYLVAKKVSKRIDMKMKKVCKT